MTIFCDKDVWDFRGSIRCIRYSGMYIGPMDQIGILVGKVIQESSPCRDKSRFIIHVIFVQVTGHECRKAAAKADR